ncbi:MAG: beta-Ala-His dipeptidase [Clostridia bacterium]|nr:beta-Ala-His dipeptidase [Clostridia bacterium]
MKYLDFFYEISKISRPSGSCEKMADYLCAFAEERGLECNRDSLHNVIIKKPATSGYEGHDAVMLQGHTDMVCCVGDGVEWDFANGVEVVREGDVLSANGTTLGADNGIAVAYMLSILDSKELSHPALECVFTSDEETGLYGANAIDLSKSEAKYLINMDSEEEGVITAGCCGGLRMDMSFDGGEKSYYIGDVYRLSITGFRGGHSGTDIDHGRMNAICAVTHILRLCENNPSYRLVSFDGGEKDNAIPRNVSVVFCGGNEELIQSAIDVVLPGMVACEPDSKVTFEKISTEGAEVFSREFTDNIVGFLSGCPNGVLDRSLDPGNPPTISDNIGVVKTEGNNVRITVSFRAYDDDYRDRYSARVKKIAEQCGAVVNVHSKYPGWAKSESSALRDKMCQVWQEMTGEEMKVQMIHAGLECGILISKCPQLDAVSIGPNMEGVHTPDEKLDLVSAEKCFGFICELLKNM